MYALIRDNFTIIKTKTDRLDLKCKHCGKIIYDSRFDWEKWTIDTHQEFIFIESKINFHLIFKCKVINIKV